MLRRYCIVIAFILSLMGVGCAGNPPVSERAVAKVAMESARSGQAESHAREEYRKAKKTMEQVDRAFQNKDYKNARILSNIASLQAKYALAVANWKTKSGQLKKTEGTLKKAKWEAEQARLALEDAKEQLRK